MKSFLRYLNESIDIYQVEQKMNELYMFIIGNISEEYSAVKTVDLNNYDKLIYTQTLESKVGTIQEPQKLNGIQIYIVNYNKPEMGITVDCRLPNAILGNYFEKTGKFTSFDMLNEYLVELLVELKQVMKPGK